MSDGTTEHGATTSEAELLIVLGRDREAVAAATRQGGAMDGLQQLDHVIPMLDKLVHDIEPADLDRPTPCASFTVAGVLEHMAGGANHFGPVFRGETPPAPSDDDTRPVQERWSAALADLLDAAHSPGAQERMLATPFGEVSGADFARYVAFDGLVHGWDLSTAVGKPYDPPAELVTEADAFARSFLQSAMRDGDTFAAEKTAPPGASPIEALVAFSGRDVQGDPK